MKFSLQRLALFSLLVFFCCHSFLLRGQALKTLPASALQPFGRYLMNADGRLELISTAVHFGFSFEGQNCQLFTSLANSQAHGFLQYVIDGEYIKRIRVDGNEKGPVIIAAKSAGKHTVEIYKATEATSGPVFIDKIAGANLQPLKNSTLPVIEFIGNSITCGAAADASEIPCNLGEYQDHHNAYDAYGPRVARALGVNFIVSAVSGIGVYRNWNSDGPAMPQVYEKARLQENDEQSWNFSSYKPKIVSIALGTNDFSRGDGTKKRLPFDSVAFTGAYIKFVQLVKSKYPSAQVALLSSPMINGSARETLQNCLSAVKAAVDALYPSGKKVELFFFEPMQARGCSGHPSVEDHAILAEQLTPFFKKLL